MRFILPVVMLFLMVGQVRAEVPYGQFQSICTDTCASGADRGYCERYCGCVIDGVKAKGGDDTAQTGILESETLMHDVTMTCAANINMDLLGQVCKTQCAAGNCRTCTCINEQLRAVGSAVQIGEFFVEVGEGKAAAKAKMTAIQQSCSR